jgi:hypothetical protein
MASAACSADPPLSENARYVHGGNFVNAAGTFCKLLTVCLATKIELCLRRALCRTAYIDFTRVLLGGRSIHMATT